MKRIRFRDCGFALEGRQGKWIFYLYENNRQAAPEENGKTFHVAIKRTGRESLEMSMEFYHDFTLEDAKEFCQQIADGKIGPTELCALRGAIERTVRRVVWRNGQLMPETEREEKTETSNCVGLNVYLGRKEQGGILLHGVEEIVLPTVAIGPYNTMEPMFLKLKFQSMAYAEDVIKALGKVCTIEIRAAVQHLNELGNWEVCGNFYILEAEPLKIVPGLLSKGSDTEVTILFQVFRYTAKDETDREWWSFERLRSDSK